MEFGSDFHMCDYPVRDNSNFLQGKNFYASGRQALLHLIESNNWSRLWVPSYFCEESLDTVRQLIEIKYYSIIPGQSFEGKIPTEQLRATDALLIVNYFGLYGFQDTSKYPCAVIEDHTHDLVGDWASNSIADWCIASLRKTLPIADGGILWSPQGKELPLQPLLMPEVAGVVERRYKAMDLKRDYLLGKNIDKDAFLNPFRFTEEEFSNFELSNCSVISRKILENIDIEKWYELKRQNYIQLKSLLHFRHSAPLITDIDGITQFSMVIIFDDAKLRDVAREYLIRNKVYPAILWPDINPLDSSAYQFASQMLSIHCDGRYSLSDISLLASILNQIL